LICYEHAHAVILHAFRKKIAKEIGYEVENTINNYRFISCTCGISLKVDLSKGSIFRCPNCKKEWDTNGKIKSVGKATGSKSATTKNNANKEIFSRESDVETIRKYLSEQEKKGNPISFYYRKDTTPRTFTNYFIDGIYVKVKSSKGYYIKFLIDKIRKV